MKNLIFTDEVRAKIRKDMADLYRKVRKDNPAMARLLFKREKYCLKIMLAALIDGEDLCQN